MAFDLQDRLRWAMRTRGRRLPRRAVQYCNCTGPWCNDNIDAAPGMARHRHHRSAHKVWLSNAMAELTNLPCLVLSCCVVSCLVLYCRVLCGVVLICVVLYVLWCCAMSTPSETGSCLCVCACVGGCMHACMQVCTHACIYVCMYVSGFCQTPDAGRGQVIRF